ncbi:MAG: type I-U CRISPR-associated protein Csb2 [Pirellulaceae bacterium]|nr:type I-U CRISPR-associated protein Csb2 [Pirellulaceae bacterium]
MRSIPLQQASNLPKTIAGFLLELSSPGGKTGLPPVECTLPQAEQLHRQIIGKAANGRRIVCPELIGCDGDGKPLEGPHRHTHVLPVDLDGDRYLDHVLIYAPMGLGEVAQQAIRSVRHTLSNPHGETLGISVIAFGDLQQLMCRTQTARAAFGGLASQDGKTTRWISLTPFVPPRYAKKSGKNSVVGQIKAELSSRGLPAALDIEILPEDSLRMRRFKRIRRQGSKPPPVDVGYAIDLSLTESIHGPLCLGYASHFGLGLFCVAD